MDRGYRGLWELLKDTHGEPSLRSFYDGGCKLGLLPVRRRELQSFLENLDFHGLIQLAHSSSRTRLVPTTSSSAWTARRPPSSIRRRQLNSKLGGRPLVGPRRTPTSRAASSPRPAESSRRSANGDVAGSTRRRGILIGVRSRNHSVCLCLIALATCPVETRCDPPKATRPVNLNNGLRYRYRAADVLVGRGSVPRPPAMLLEAPSVFCPMLGASSFLAGRLSRGSSGRTGRCALSWTHSDDSLTGFIDCIASTAATQATELVPCRW